MPGLVIKNLPPDLHRRLKESAERHHRSMTKEVISVLEQALEPKGLAETLPPPYKGRIALTDKMIEQARRKGRE
jgi:plasmid stability protein